MFILRTRAYGICLERSKSSSASGRWCCWSSLCCIAAPGQALHYLESRSFTEPAFVFVIMVIAASRPIIDFAGALLHYVSRALPFDRPVAYYFTLLSVGPLLGSFITEPAAMTLAALLLRERFFSRNAPKSFLYATVGVLFVNISIGGTLTPYAAPPVLMVADKWGLDLAMMLKTFGWKAAVAVLINAAGVTFAYRKYLRDQPTISPALARLEVPGWIIGIHLLFLTSVVIFSHHPMVFIALFLFFLGFTEAYKRCQSRLMLREGLMVAFFLGGLVVLGGQQRWWLQPLLADMSPTALYFGGHPSHCHHRQRSADLSGLPRRRGLGCLQVLDGRRRRHGRWPHRHRQCAQSRRLCNPERQLRGRRDRCCRTSSCRNTSNTRRRGRIPAPSRVKHMASLQSQEHSTVLRTAAALHSHKVLVVIDGSERTGRVIEYALSFAQDGRGVEAVLLVVVPEPADGRLRGYGSFKRDEIHARLKYDIGQRAIAAAARRFDQAGVSYKDRVEIGDPADTILRVAGEEGCDVVLVGDAPAGTFRRWLPKVDRALCDYCGEPGRSTGSDAGQGIAAALLDLWVDWSAMRILIPESLEDVGVASRNVRSYILQVCDQQGV